MKLIAALCCILFLQEPFKVKSPDFANGHMMPFRFTCDEKNLSPGLSFENLPKGTKSLALIVDDTESPNGEFVHWVMWNIPTIGPIKENSAPGIQGKNSRGENKYFGPCPPNGLHTYNFKLYALDINLNINKSSGKSELLKAMEGHTLAEAIVTGKYKSNK
jgi:Raf kinase inhibitor-like YbhB/YbcL family protein